MEARDSIQNVNDMYQLGGLVHLSSEHSAHSAIY